MKLRKKVLLADTIKVRNIKGMPFIVCSICCLLHPQTYTALRFEICSILLHVKSNGACLVRSAHKMENMFSERQSQHGQNHNQLLED